MDSSTLQIIKMLPNRLNVLVNEILEGRTVEGLQIPSNITAGEYLLLILLERSIKANEGKGF